MSRIAAGSVKGAKKKCDVLFSRMVRSRGQCEHCGEREYSKLQCAHIISRRFSHTRCDIRNAVCLCAKCHHHFTDRPVEFGLWVTGLIGAEEYENLRWWSQQRTKVDWSAVLADLKSHETSP